MSLRRLLAGLLVLLVVGETSGIARAFGPGAIVHCCCGDHQSARPCPCPDCPVLLRRAHDHRHHDARLMTARDCSGASVDDPGVLRVVAAALAVPSLTSPSPRLAADFAAPRALADRATDPARPPP